MSTPIEQLSPEQLDADEALALAATEGPWIAVTPSSQEGGAAIAHAGPTWTTTFREATSVRPARGDSREKRTAAQDAVNARLIARAREALPAYIAEVRRLRAELERLQVPKGEAPYAPPRYDEVYRAGVEALDRLVFVQDSTAPATEPVSILSEGLCATCRKPCKRVAGGMRVHKRCEPRPTGGVR